MITKEQLAQLNEHLKEFQELTDRDTVEEYFEEYSYIDDLYERVCSDLEIEPLP